MWRAAAPAGRPTARQGLIRARGETAGVELERWRRALASGRLENMSIGTAMRTEQFARLKRLAPEQRIELALESGRRDLALYAAAQLLSKAEARRRLKAQRGIGRLKSVAAE